MIEKLTIKRSRQKVIAYSVIIIWLMIVNIWLLNNYHLNSSTLTRHGNGDNLIDEDDDLSSSSEYSIYNELDTENYLGQQHQEEDVPNSQSTDNSLIKPTSPGKNSFKDDITIKILQSIFKNNKIIQKIFELRIVMQKFIIKYLKIIHKLIQY